MHASASRILLADRDITAARSGAARVNKLAGRPLVEPTTVDGLSDDSLRRVLAPASAALSALPYQLNPRAVRSSFGSI